MGKDGFLHFSSDIGRILPKRKNRSRGNTSLVTIFQGELLTPNIGSARSAQKSQETRDCNRCTSILWKKTVFRIFLAIWAEFDQQHEKQSCSPGHFLQIYRSFMSFGQKMSPGEHFLRFPLILFCIPKAKK